MSPYTILSLLVRIVYFEGLFEITCLVINCVSKERNEIGRDRPTVYFYRFSTNDF